MIAKGENNEDLYQPAEWRAAREKVLRNVKEVCETVCPVVREAHSSPSRPLPAAEGARPTRRGGQNLRNATAAANRWMRSDAYSHVDTAYSSDW
eukprot:g18756.t1